MAIELYAVGGYDNVGKNMTAIRFFDERSDDVIILDIGLDLENYVEFKSEKRGCDLKEEELKDLESIPDDSIISDFVDNVRLIVAGHVHLDHIGAIPYLGNKYDCPVLATPFTIEVLKVTCADEGIKLRNKYIKLEAGNTFKVNDLLSVEFVNITHSTPQTVLVVIHYMEKDGSQKNILYANDYKLDKTPIVEISPDFDKLREMGKDGIDVMISNCLYSSEDIHAPSENRAREMLLSEFKDKDVQNRAIIVTTFSSHIARLKSIVELARKLDRKIIFIGRSLKKYIESAKKAGIIDLEEDGEIISSRSKVKERFKDLSNRKTEYVIVCTGHQGEPNSVLWKLVNKEIKFNFQPNDVVIFSSNVIPTPYNEKLREDIEEKLKSMRINIIKDIHVSGHLAGRDYKDVLKILKPKLLIPTHGPEDLAKALIKIAENVEDIDIKTLRCHDGHKYKIC